MLACLTLFLSRREVGEPGGETERLKKEGAQEKERSSLNKTSLVSI